MQGGICLIGLKINYKDIIYKISNINFVPGPNSLYIELESKKYGIMNVPIKEIQDELGKLHIKHILDINFPIKYK